MQEFFVDNIISIVFGIIATIIGIISIIYAKKQHKRKYEFIIDDSKQFILYLSRKSVLGALADMCNEAKENDIIWGQCVSCKSYTQDVGQIILNAAGRGATYNLIMNSTSPVKDELEKIFTPINSARIKERDDNKFGILGLSDKMVIVSLPNSNSYTAVKISDPNLLEVIKTYFYNRWND